MQENHVVFGADGAWLTTRRIDGQFPNYHQLLPEQFEHELELPREELLDVVRRVGLLAQRNSPLRLRFAEGELTVSARTQDVGEARESLPAPYAADPLEIGFNAEFLRDGLESIDSSTVRVKLISPLRPAVLAGRDAGLHLPDHADPPRGLSRRSLIVGHVRLRNFRSYAALDLALTPGSGRRDRRERCREDEPARGAARRHPGVLAADAQRRAADPVRRDRGGRLASRRRGRGQPRGAR